MEKIKQMIEDFSIIGIGKKFLGLAGYMIGTSLFFLLFIWCLSMVVPNCKSVDKATEIFSSERKITEQTDREASCTSFALSLSQQQLIKKSDQNLAESIINVCNSRFIAKDCTNWSKLQFKSADECRAFYLSRK